MATKEQREHRDGADQRVREALFALIGEQVIHALGEPGDLLKVQVRPVGENHYRVNVVVGEDAGCARVADSYFLVTDEDGNVLRSTPAITRRY